MQEKKQYESLYANEITQYALLLAILLLGFSLRIYRLGYQSFWYDELTTINRATMPIRDMFEDLLAIRNHVPLYFFLMRFWSQLGTNEFIIRFSSTLWSMISLALIFKTGRSLHNTTTGLVAVTLLAISPFHIWYSQEARMYTFLVTTIMAAYWFLIRLLYHETRRNWWGYALSMLLAIFTHYFAFLILLAHYLFFALHFSALKSLFLKWLRYCLLIGLPFAAWVLLIISAEGLDNMVPDWISTISFYEPLLTLVSFSAGPTINLQSWTWIPAVAVYSVGMILSLRPTTQPITIKTRARDKLVRHLLWLWLIVPISIIYITSMQWSPTQQTALYVDRYLLITLPALILLTAKGITSIGINRQRFAPLFLLLLVALSSLFALKNLYFNSLYTREDWRDAAALLSYAMEPEDIILTRPDYILPLSYYLKEPFSTVAIPAAVNHEEQKQAFADEMLYRFSVIPHAHRAWLISLSYNDNAHGFPHGRNEAVAHTNQINQHYSWMNSHYSLLDEWVFTGIRLSLFDITQTEQ